MTTYFGFILVDDWAFSWIGDLRLRSTHITSSCKEDCNLLCTIPGQLLLHEYRVGRNEPDSGLWESTSPERHNKHHWLVNTSLIIITIAIMTIEDFALLTKESGKMFLINNW